MLLIRLNELNIKITNLIESKDFCVDLLELEYERNQIIKTINNEN